MSMQKLKEYSPEKDKSVIRGAQKKMWLDSLTHIRFQRIMKLSRTSPFVFHRKEDNHTGL